VDAPEIRREVVEVLLVLGERLALRHLGVVDGDGLLDELRVGEAHAEALVRIGADGSEPAGQRRGGRGHASRAAPADVAGQADDAVCDGREGGVLAAVRGRHLQAIGAAEVPDRD
jgi:hypothetical protein